VAQKVRELEFKLESLENSKNTMSLKAFSNSMFYNIFISIFVALTGGFAEYTNSSQSSVDNFGGIIIVIIIHGLKWGLLSFIIGLVVSAFTSVSTVISIYTQKQRISKVINDTNSYKQRIIDALSADLETRKQRLVSNATVLLNNHKKNLERLGIEKEKKMNSLKLEIDETIEKEIAPFLLLID
jgi:hypothetical protein